MNKEILKLLAKDARMSVGDIALATDLSEEEVKAEIFNMEENGLIRGYKTVIDWESIDSASVSAIIELKVTPKAGYGFEEIAERITKYPEVESCYLMSGVYDLNVVVRGKSFQEVAQFVAKELSTIESVTSTATHFVLRRYKDFNVELANNEPDERGTVSL
ncbi:MAG: Lrp/AsnC family transcriptional regulator [Ruminococcaceae bacterium]|nr:Lrp/AsnC family transcriptional regulator [Oscillospiraceae bacterium]